MLINDRYVNFTKNGDPEVMPHTKIEWFSISLKQQKVIEVFTRRAELKHKAMQIVSMLGFQPWTESFVQLPKELMTEHIADLEDDNDIAQIDFQVVSDQAVFMRIQDNILNAMAKAAAH